MKEKLQSLVEQTTKKKRKAFSHLISKNGSGKKADATAYNTFEEAYEEYSDGCLLTDNVAWLNECCHVDFDWMVIDTTSEDILQDPYSMAKMYAMITPDNPYISGNVIVDMDEIVDNDLEGFLDILSYRLTGSPLLMDVNYKAIDTLEDGRIILNVRGDVSEILEINEDFCEELKNVITNAGPEAIEDFIGISPLDYHVEKDLDNILDSTIDQMPDEELIRFYQKYAKEV